MDYRHQGIPTDTQIQEAVDLWRLVPPTTKISTRRALKLRNRYDSAIYALSSSGGPDHDVIVTELRATVGYLQELIDRRLQNEESRHV